MKFSIIVPVWNVEKYIEKALQSVKNQTYKNFEVIIVNDESPDNSQAIIDKFAATDERFRSFKKKNGGISDARNFGLSQVTGDYIMFLDSDDYYEPELLMYINEEIRKYPELDYIKYQFKVVDEQGELIELSDNHCFSDFPSKTAILNIMKDKFIEVCWAGAYKTDFFKKNEFIFPVGKVQEDFKIMIEITATAKYISSIPYIGINYVKRSGSYMSEKDYQIIKQRVFDFLEHHDNHVEFFKKYTGADLTKKLLLSYSAEATIDKGRELSDIDLKEYIKALKRRGTIKLIFPSTYRKFLKKVYISLFLKKYIISRREGR